MAYTFYNKCDFFIFIYSVIFKNSIFAETKNYAKDIDISFSFGV